MSEISPSLSPLLRRFDAPSSSWRAKSISNQDFLGVSRAPGGSLGIGRHSWQIYNDSRHCSSESSYFTNLTLTSCTQDQFSCDDGSCIRQDSTTLTLPGQYIFPFSLSERCDGTIQCRDASDERDCSLIVPHVGYNKFMVPVGPHGRLTLNLSLHIR